MPAGGLAQEEGGDEGVDEYGDEGMDDEEGEEGMPSLGSYNLDPNVMQ